MKELFEKLKDILDWGVHIGEGDKGIHLTLGLLLLLLVSILLASVILRLIRVFITRKMEREDKLKFISIFQFLKYAIYLVVVLLTLSAAGIDITLLITASAALFVGLGLALQDLFQDLIGGIFILVDKTLQVGDVINIEGKVAKVEEVKLRTTRAYTADDKVIIIPNHKFITDIVYNYTQNRKITLETVKVGVAYGSDVELVRKSLLESLNGVENILHDPEPGVIFEDFGDSSLVFSVRFFVLDSLRTAVIKSAVRFNIDALFRANQITIPFPQRDVHLIDHTKPDR